MPTQQFSDNKLSNVKTFLNCDLFISYQKVKNQIVSLHTLYAFKFRAKNLFVQKLNYNQNPIL